MSNSKAKTVRRRIGDAVIEIEFTGRTVGGRWVYRGEVTAPSAIVTVGLDGRGEKKPVVWRFDDLRSCKGGVADGRGGKHAPDSDEVFDILASVAVAHGASLTDDDGGDPETIERAAAIDGATMDALRDDGTYEVIR